MQEDCHLKNRDDADEFNFATDDENIDLNISGIVDEAVKRSQNFNIYELIRRIASHPQQEAVLNDLEQQQSFYDSVTSQRLQSWMQETLRFARSSTWSRSGNARCVSTIAVQGSYTAYVDVL